MEILEFVKAEDGPTAVEYAVMLALIIVVCIGAITALGQGANKTFQKDLEYATINYKLMSNWSVYAQYATGILVPDISAFQVSGPTANPSAGPDLSNLVPQTSTNYQLGTVYHGANWTADFALYKIDFKNKIATITGSAATPARSGRSGCDPAADDAAGSDRPPVALFGGAGW